MNKVISFDGKTIFSENIVYLVIEEKHLTRQIVEISFIDNSSLTEEFSDAKSASKRIKEIITGAEMRLDIVKLCDGKYIVKKFLVGLGIEELSARTGGFQAIACLANGQKLVCGEFMYENVASQKNNNIIKALGWSKKMFFFGGDCSVKDKVIAMDMAYDFETQPKIRINFVGGWNSVESFADKNEVEARTKELVDLITS